MRILLIHNYYRSGTPGGEDVVFAQERDLLESAGHEVICYTRTNDEMRESNPIDWARTAMGVHRSTRTRRELGDLLRERRPEIAHTHNTFPLISESAIEACRSAGVPVVQTVHNYRNVCIAATHFREGRVCEDCVPGDSSAGIKNRCYRNRGASALLAWSIARNHEDRLRQARIARYFALNRFMAQRLQASGVGSSHIVVKPNFVRRPDAIAVAPKGYALFCGRLSVEKGLRTLLDAWRDASLPLKIVGDGPLREEIRERAHRERLNVELLGMRARRDVFELLAGASVLIVPSVWFEGQPLVALEAFAVGVPVVASRIGGLAELVGDDEFGFGFAPCDAAALRAAVQRVQRDPAHRDRVVAAALARSRDYFSPQYSLQLLESTYRDVLNARVAA